MLGWVVAAVGFHAALAGGLAWLSSERQAGPSDAASSAAAVVVRRIEPSASRIAVASEKPFFPAAATSTQRGRVAQAEPANAAQAAGRSRRYYDITEVDSPAVPLTDWQVDVNQLVELRIRRMHFEIRISEAGSPERCLVTLIEPPAPAASSSFEKQLCSTPMSAAIKAGAGVPSTRRIELVLGS